MLSGVEPFDGQRLYLESSPVPKVPARHSAQQSQAGGANGHATRETLMSMTTMSMMAITNLCFNRKLLLQICQMTLGYPRSPTAVASRRSLLLSLKHLTYSATIWIS